jgi:hypothetical protein
MRLNVGDWSVLIAGFGLVGVLSLGGLIHQITIPSTQSMPIRGDLPPSRCDIAALGLLMDARGKSQGCL